MSLKKKPTVPTSHQILKRIFGCKWSLSIYPLLRAGVNRPGAIERRIDGMTAKVLSECLRKNVELGILQKNIFPEIPPRVEYQFTDLGQRFLKVFAVVESFQKEIDNAPSMQKRIRGVSSSRAKKT